MGGVGLGTNGLAIAIVIGFMYSKFHNPGNWLEKRRLID